MAEIPPPLASTTLAIDEAIVAKARASDWGGVPMSAVTNECDRSVWLSLHWAHEPEQPEGRRERRFRTGIQYERWLLDDLRSAGCEVIEIDETTGKQMAVELAGGHLRGKLDGRVTGLPEAPKTEHVVECKSMKAADFRAVVKHGLAKAKPDHHAQCLLYMHATGIKRCLYICANKDTDEIHTERLEYDTGQALVIVARIERIVAATSMLNRASDDPDAFVCRFCRAKPLCHEGAWPRQNCRTCLHSSPVDGGKWRCEKHDRHLSWDEQHAGCSSHRFIPALVPGEQIDVRDGDLIVYRLADGSEWMDGMREGANV